jgi:hypothetical protein
MEISIAQSFDRQPMAELRRPGTIGVSRFAIWCAV